MPIVARITQEETSNPCVCNKLARPPCYYCRNPRTPEEREAFIQAGITRTMGVIVPTTVDEWEKARKEIRKSTLKQIKTKNKSKLK